MELQPWRLRSSPWYALTGGPSQPRIAEPFPKGEAAVRVRPVRRLWTCCFPKTVVTKFEVRGSQEPVSESGNSRLQGEIAGAGGTVKIFIRISLLAVGLVLVGTGLCEAQTLPLGTISNSASVTCTTNFYHGSACTDVTVSCPNVADIQATYGYVEPKETKVGVVALVNGAEDLTPGGAHYVGAYLSYGFAIEQVEFAAGWEVTGEIPNLKNAACRLATLLNYMQEATRSFPFGVHAGSAGAGAVGYAMAWYGWAPQAVELTSGPSFSDIELGCEVPRPAHLLVVPTNGGSWTDLLNYNETNTEANMQAWTGDPTCAGTKYTSQESDDAWKAMSIVSPGRLLFRKRRFPAGCAITAPIILRHRLMSGLSR